MTEDTDTPSEIVLAEPRAVAPSAAGASSALDTYLQIQRVFDEKMPDAIMTISGKKFRKKSYWRAIATAFRVETELVAEERVEIGDDWGFTATYRATTADGRHCDGDGACMASEKRGAMVTIHNVRAHAHTRAKNRAISDLVGFGEVSADELGPESYEERQYPSAKVRDRVDVPATKASPKSKSKPKRAYESKSEGVKLATEKQLNMLKAKSYSRAEELGDGSCYDNIHEFAASIRKAAMHELGFDGPEEITFAGVNAMVSAIEAASLDDNGEVAMPDGGVF